MTNYNHAGSREIAVVLSEKCQNNLPDDTAMTVPSNPNKIGEKTSVFGKTGTLFLSAP